jgi:hypothetical protein
MSVTYAHLNVVNDNEFNRGDQQTYKLSSGYTYTQSFTTAQARRANGMDSVVLVYNGLQRLEESMTVHPMLDKDLLESKCAVQEAYSSITWLEPAVSPDWFQWVSRWEIENVILPQQKRVVDTLEAQENRTRTNDELVSRDLLGTLLERERISLLQWEDTLEEFNRSITRAEPFLPAITEADGNAGGNMRRAYNKLPGENPLPETGVGTLTKWPDRAGPSGSHAGLDPARTVGLTTEEVPALNAADDFQRPIHPMQEDSPRDPKPGYFVSFSGGGGATTFTLEMEAGEERQDEDNAKIQAKLGIDVRHTTYTACCCDRCI